MICCWIAEAYIEIRIEVLEVVLVNVTLMVHGVGQTGGLA